MDPSPRLHWVPDGGFGSRVRHSPCSGIKQCEQRAGNDQQLEEVRDEKRRVEDPTLLSQRQLWNATPQE